MSAFQVKKHKFTISLLALIFLLPMIAAWLSFSKGLFLSGGTVNHGILLRPPLSIDNLELLHDNEKIPRSKLHGKWWLIYFTEHLNDNFSKHKLYYMRQIRQATGKDRDRIERAVLTSKLDPDLAGWLQRYYPGTYYFSISSEKLAELKLSLPKKLALKNGSLYLVDPLGNIILFYAPNAVPKHILKDLQRVLKVSQIG